MDRFCTRVLGRFALVAIALIGASAYAQTYRVTNIGTIGGDTRGVVLNSSGEVTGTSVPIGHSAAHAFRYSGGTMIDLRSLGGAGSAGADINASGRVTGSANTPRVGCCLTPHAFISDGAAMTDLGTLAGGAGDSAGNAINDGGHVVGSAATASGPEHAFITDGATMVDLGTLGGPLWGEEPIEVSHPAIPVHERMLIAACRCRLSRHLAARVDGRALAEPPTERAEIGHCYAIADECVGRVVSRFRTAGHMTAIVDRGRRAVRSTQGTKIDHRCAAGYKGVRADKIIIQERISRHLGQVTGAADTAAAGLHHAFLSDGTTMTCPTAFMASPSLSGPLVALTGA